MKSYYVKALIGGSVFAVLAVGGWMYVGQMQTAGNEPETMHMHHMMPMEHMHHNSAEVAGEITRAEIQSLVDTYPPAEAYEKFKELNNNTEGVSMQHHFAHIFGDQLFQKEGDAAISVCDSSFGNGCLHSVVGNIVNEQGLRNIQELNQKCMARGEDKWGNCQHGLGHGILFYLGHDKLQEALDVCESLSDDSALIWGCQGGVFMEYNLHTVATHGGVEPREMTDNGPLYPCESIDALHQSTCYYRQPAWLNHVFDGSNAEKTTELSDVCRTVPDEKNRNWCYRGIGRVMFYRFGSDLTSAVAACDAATEGEARAYCYAGFRRNYEAEYPDKESLYICDAFAGHDKVACSQEPPKGF